MKILVTGSAGFIGYHLVKKLTKAGHKVVGIDNINQYYDVKLKYDRLAKCGIEAIKLSTKKNSAIDSSPYQLIQSATIPEYSFSKLDITDSEKLNVLFASEKFDVVCNLAAQAGVRYSIQNPKAYIKSNLVGFFNILEACRHNVVKHLVYASSSSVYGNSGKKTLSVNDRTDNPVSLYAATKKSNELMAHTYSHLFNLKTTGLRFFTVYGPWGRPDMAPILFASAIKNGETIQVFNNGNLERDFTYIDDIIEGLSRIILQSEKLNTDTYSIFNIGNGNPVKLLDFISILEEKMGKKAKKKFVDMQPGDVYRTFADVSELKEKYGYKPQTLLIDGIENFIKWYETYYTENKNS
ncbi:MAG: NAD-dependent epimerase [Draconibacterium sp.]|nr:MAG: NAD-dependent epimerase [Draconibacterium sp.]